MKDRKSFKNSYNAMEQELSFQKGLRKKTKTKTKTNTKKKTKTKTKTKNEKDPTCAIFSESRGCKDIKYDLFTKKFSRNFPEIFLKFFRNFPEIFSENEAKFWPISPRKCYTEWSRNYFPQKRLPQNV